MTDRDCRTVSGNSSSDRPFESASPAVAVYVSASVLEKSDHGLAAMVAGDVGVQVLPDAFDAVGIGAVGREEVQHDSPVESGQDLARATRGMDAVVIDDHVDAMSASVAAREQPEQLAEQGGVLSIGTRGVQPAGPYVERASQVELLILERARVN
jgi:hypothetical protein